MSSFWKAFIISGCITYVLIMGKGIYDACHLSEEDEKMVEESVDSFFNDIKKDMQKDVEEKLRKAAGL